MRTPILAVLTSLLALWLSFAASAHPYDLDHHEHDHHCELYLAANQAVSTSSDLSPSFIVQSVIDAPQIVEKTPVPALRHRFARAPPYSSISIN
ncbi:DUF2607 family protein [Vibrio maerlii]|uniref:DUF2607 family protein n=1 Tax=Vibrio maerlii TaxID=2231648 RepID=UPI000E3BF4A3|nr:DUF2607 family protein [Vibrio maerlii]